MKVLKMSFSQTGIIFVVQLTGDDDVRSLGHVIGLARDRVGQVVDFGVEFGHFGF